MPDHQFVDLRLAACYDAFCGWDERDDLAFYLPLVMRAASVLDVGCGTGMLLHRARDAGHRGRLCGLDPAVGMLTQARLRDDVEWVLGDLTTTSFAREFDLVVMSGHAFQVFVTDAEIHAALHAVRAALEDGGTFAFETRNPLARAWESWTPAHAVERTVASGERVRAAHRVDAVTAETVAFTTTYTSTAWPRAEVSTSTLRFLDRDPLGRLLAAAGFAIEAQYGDWDGRPCEVTSPEIITIARAR